MFDLLKDLSTLNEMAKPAQSCPKCGLSPLSKTHRYYKGAWVCPPGAAQKAAGGAPPTAAAPATPTQPIIKPTSGIAKAATSVAAPAPAKPSARVAPAPASVAKTTQAAGGGANSEFTTAVTTWLNNFSDVTKFTVNDDHSIDINQNAFFNKMPFKKIPVKIKTVKELVVAGGLLETLDNFPEVVEGNLTVMFNDLTSFKGGPRTVKGACTVEGNFELSSFEGAPERIEGDLNIRQTGFASLQGIEDHIKFIGGKLIAKDMKRVEKLPDGKSKLSDGQVTSHIMGVFLIDGITKVELDNEAIAKIINKHLPDRDMEMCQEELIEAGFGSHAKI